MSRPFPQRARTVAALALLAAALVLTFWLLNSGRARPEASPTVTPPPPERPMGAALAMVHGSGESLLNNLGVEHAAAGRYSEAITHFREAVSLDADYLPGWRNLLAVCVEAGRWAEAREAAERLEKLHPLAEHLRSAEPPEDEGAAASLRKENDLIANLGRAYLESGKLDRAWTRFRLLVGLAPNDLRGFNGLGDVALKRGLHEEALRLYARSLSMYGDQPEVAARLAEVAEVSPELAAKVEWALAQYAEPRPVRSSGPAPAQRRPIQELGLPLRDPEPVVRLPKAPVPEVD